MLFNLVFYRCTYTVKQFSNIFYQKIFLKFQECRDFCQISPLKLYCDQTAYLSQLLLWWNVHYSTHCWKLKSSLLQHLYLEIILFKTALVFRESYSKNVLLNCIKWGMQLVAKHDFSSIRKKNHLLTTCCITSTSTKIATSKKRAWRRRFVCGIVANRCWFPEHAIDGSSTLGSSCWCLVQSCDNNNKRSVLF